MVPLSPELILFFSQMGGYYWSAFTDNGTYDGNMYILTSVLTTAYQTLGFPNIRYPRYAQAKKSSDGKTVYWYASGDADAYHQLNDPDRTYHYIAIG